MARHRSEPALPADDDILGELAADHITKLKSSGRKSEGQSAERSAGKKPADPHAYKSDAARSPKPQEQAPPADEKPTNPSAVKEAESLETVETAESSEAAAPVELHNEAEQTAKDEKAEPAAEAGVEGDYVRDDAPVRDTATAVTEEAELPDPSAAAVETELAVTVETPPANETIEDTAVDEAAETAEETPVVEAAPPPVVEQPPAEPVADESEAAAGRVVSEPEQPAEVTIDDVGSAMTQEQPAEHAEAAEADEPAADEPKSDVAFYEELMRSDQPAPPVQSGAEADDAPPVVQTRIREADDDPQDAEPLPAASGMEGIESRIMSPPPLPVGTAETTDDADETDETDDTGPIGAINAIGESEEPPPPPIPTEIDAALGSRAKHLDSGSYSVRIIGESPDIYGDGDVLIGAEPTKDISIGAEEVAFTVRIGPDEESPDWPDQSSSPLNQLAMEDIGDDVTDDDSGNEEAAATQTAPTEPPAAPPAEKLAEKSAEKEAPAEATSPSRKAAPSRETTPPKAAAAETSQGTPGLPDKEDHASSVAERIADLISEIAQKRQTAATDGQADAEPAEVAPKAPEAAKASPPPEPASETPAAPRDRSNKAEPATRAARAEEELGSAMHNLSRPGKADDDEDEDDEEVVLEGMPAPPPPDEDDDGSPIGEAVDARNFASSDIVSITNLGKNKSRRINARTKKNRGGRKRSADRPKDKSVAEELLDDQMAAETDETSDEASGKARNGRRKSGSRQLTKRETLPTTRGSNTSRKLARPTVLISPQPQNEKPRWRNLGIQAGIVLLAILATALLMWLFFFS